MGILDTTTDFERRLAAAETDRGPSLTSGGSPSPVFPVGTAGAAGDEAGNGEAVSLQPCPTCRCSWWWWDCYGGGPHCVSCSPPPIPHGSFMDRWAKADTGRNTGGNSNTDQQDRAEFVASCSHAVTDLRIVTDDNGGPWAVSVSRWRVCRRCGWWETDMTTGKHPQEPADFAPGIDLEAIPEPIAFGPENSGESFLDALNSI